MGGRPRGAESQLFSTYTMVEDMYGSARGSLLLELAVSVYDWVSVAVPLGRLVTSFRHGIPSDERLFRAVMNYGAVSKAELLGNRGGVPWVSTSLLQLVACVPRCGASSIFYMMLVHRRLRIEYHYRRYAIENERNDCHYK